MHTFAYVVVSEAGDAQTDMAVLSASFLRDVHPDADIVVLCDPATEWQLRSENHILLSISSRLVVSEPPCHGALARSRYLKSRLRSLLSGDVLFLDTDVIVRKPMDEVFLTDEPVALANNHNRPFPENFHEKEKAYYAKCGWPLPGNGLYLNTGVVFWRDCPEAHDLSELFMEAMDEAVRSGVQADQPCFNRALDKWRGRVRLLPDGFNAQVRPNPLAGLDAAVWHFYSSSRVLGPRTVFDDGMELVDGAHPAPADFIRRVRSASIHYSTDSDEQSQALLSILEEKGDLTNRAYLSITGKLPKPSSPRSFCTVITADYLPYALTLLHSIRRFDTDVHFNVFIADRSEDDFRRSPPDGNTFYHFPENVSREGIGWEIRMKYASSRMDEYRWSSKPVFVSYLLKEKGYEKVVFTDCDIHFFDRFDFLFDALDGNRVLLTPHWRTPHPENDPEEYQHLFSHGLYNAGFVGANAEGAEAMDWWAKNCLYSCAKGSFVGEYDDQTILNLMPVYFQGVHVLRHKGCNLSNWNKFECPRKIRSDGTVVIEGGYPVVFIHFSAGMPWEWDMFLGRYFHVYMDTLRQYSEETWRKEMRARKASLQQPPLIRQMQKADGQGLSGWLGSLLSAGFLADDAYWRTKQTLVGGYLSIRPWNRGANIAILSHPGVDNHCLGLWLREIPCTVLANDPVHGIAERIERAYRISDGYAYEVHDEKVAGGCDLRSLADARHVDPKLVNWTSWRSLLGIERMILNMPKGWLIAPELAADLSSHCHVLAVLIHPCQFAYSQFLAPPDEPRRERLLEVEERLSNDAALKDMVGERLTSWLSWVIRWCMDVEMLMSAQKEGKPLYLVTHEGLTWDTTRTLSMLLEKLSLRFPEGIADRFREYCLFCDRKAEGLLDGRPDTEWSDILEESEKELIDGILGHFGVDFYTTREGMPNMKPLPVPLKR